MNEESPLSRPAVRTKGLCWFVAAWATVNPIRGKTTGGVDLAAGAQDVRRMWQSRVLLLARHGWDMTCERVGLLKAKPKVNSRKYRMLHCAPSAYASSTRENPCNLSSFCPHCWGRWAKDHWLAIDQVLFALPKVRVRRRLNRSPAPICLTGTTIVVRFRAYRFPFKGSNEKATLPFLLERRTTRGSKAEWEPAIRELPNRTAEFRLLQLAGATGGLDVLDIRIDSSKPDTPGAVRRPSGWRIEVRQFLVVPTEKLKQFLVDPAVTSEGKARIKTTTNPSRVQVAWAVASVCRYPRSLLTGPRWYPIAVLIARRGRKLSTRFGSLYGQGPKPARDPAQQ